MWKPDANICEGGNNFTTQNLKMGVGIQASMCIFLWLLIKIGALWPL